MIKIRLVPGYDVNLVTETKRLYCCANFVSTRNSVLFLTMT